MKKDIHHEIKNRILILDGAMGTMIQGYRLDEAGFREIEAYGGFDRSPYDERRSTDLVFAAIKPHK